MFKSIKNIYNLETIPRTTTLTIIDSNFSCEKILYLTDNREGIDFGEKWAETLCKEYKTRNLNVGENLALFTIYLSEHYLSSKRDIGSKLNSIIIFQNEHLSKHINGWEEIRKERDRYLEKYLLLE